MRQLARQKILYGAGEMGKSAFEYYTKENQDDVYCFADTFKGGSEYCGKPVISFDEFVIIHERYDVVICIFDLFDLVLKFDKHEIYNFTTWSGLYSLTPEERKKQFSEYSRKFDKPDTRRKILYGAGYFGNLAYKFYGREQIYAFADMNKSGTTYINKPVIHPTMLADLCEVYDIIVCVNDYKPVIDYFLKLGIVNSRVFFQIIDIRSLDMTNSDYVYFYTGSRCSLREPKIIDEIKKLDFIENPRLVIRYYDNFVHSMRIINGLIPKNSRFLIGRMLDENMYYGYLTEMTYFAKRNVKYYEAPSAHHGYRLAAEPVRVYWNSLIESGLLFKNDFHKISKDILVFVIGPYMNYVSSFYTNEEINVLKTSDNKNLTVFPVHTIHSIENFYDKSDFFQKVMAEAKNFDSLTVCFYFNEFWKNQDLINRFEACGAKIVTAGYIWDPSFAKRLKSIILLSDAIASNDWGSHVIHALSMNKPIKLLKQKVEWHDNRINKLFRNSETINKMKSLEIDNYHITQEQINAHELNAGFSLVKTKEEMAAIFDLSKNIIQKCGYDPTRYVDSIRQIYHEFRNTTNPNEKLQFKMMCEALPDDYEDYLRKIR